MAMVSRTISLVNRYELKIAGCCHKDAIAFGDVDNDGVNELVVGTYNGVLFIYKAGVIAPWRRASGLGVVVAIAIGDIFNVGRNSLVVVSAEGMCNIFDNIKPPASEDRKSRDGNGKTFANCRHKGRFKSADDGLKPVYVQRIQANVRNALLVDATGDGRVELIVSLTDRVVRTYRWTPGYRHVTGDSSTSTSAGSTASLASGNGNVTVAVSASGAAITPLPPGGGNGGVVVLNNGENPATPAAPTPGAVPIEVMNAMAAGSNGTVAAGSISIGVGVSVSDGKVLEDPTYIGHLAGIHKWDLGSHLHSITIHHEPEQSSSPVDFFGELEAKREEEGGRERRGNRKRILRPSDQIYLLLSQPGGDLLRFSFRAADTHGMPSGSTAEGENLASDLDLVFQRLPAPSRIKNHHISCVVLGDVLMPSSTGGGHVLGYCIVSLDGTIILFQNNLERWHLTVDDELFAVSKVDVTGDGYDEIVACGWSGNTYIVNHKKECVRFVLDEPACNFTAGPFGPGNAPCFVYGTFKSRLLVYPNVKISHMLPTNLADQLNQPQNSPLKETLEGLLKRSSGQPEVATDEEIPLEFRTDLVSCFRRLSTPLAHLRSGPSDQEEVVPSLVANYPSFLPLETPRIFTDRTPDVKKAADMAELISELLYGDGKECVRRMNYYEKMRQLKVELRKKEVSLRPRPRSRSV